MKNSPNSFPNLGFGLGLRPKHYRHIFEHLPDVDWFEIISENFMDTDGLPRRNLDLIAERYPLVMHGVALSIGTVDPLNSEYLKKLKKLANDIRPAWISDHLCWTGIAHKNSHDLLPIPYTQEALKHIVDRIKQVQDFLERPIALENPSTYLEFKNSEISEARFIAEMAAESGCYLLLDVNNVYVTCYNHRLDPQAYIDTLPLDKVIQIHLSGHSNYGTHIIDTHDDHVVEEVWSLYKYVIHKAGRVPNTMIEWDDNIPEFDVLYSELNKAKQAAKNAISYAPLPNLKADESICISNFPVALADNQNRMLEAILKGKNVNSNPDEWVRSKDKFSSQDQLDVYINAYRFRLYDVVAEDFPNLKKYLGDDNFDCLIKDFVNTTHSSHFNIGRYAVGLSTFFQTHRLYNICAQEIIILETAISQLSDQEETIPLEPKHLEGKTPESLMEYALFPRKALQIFEFNFPINSYFQEDFKLSFPTLPQPEKSFLAVFRHEDIVWRMDLEADEYSLLNCLFSGVTIGDALADLDESFAQKISEYFSRWVRNGLLAHYEIKTQL